MTTSPTTFSQLTADAAACLHRAGACVDGAPADQLAAATALHGELASALAHLGRVLAAPIGSSATGRRATLSASQADRRLVSQLEAAGRPRDWSRPGPSAHPLVSEVHHAARLTGAAADLWATHRTSTGAPRSVESSRLRHPAMRGAAWRQWHCLVAAGGGIATGLLDRLDQVRRDPADPRPELGASLRAFPIIDASPTSQPPVDLTVARPGTSHPSADPLAAIGDLVGRVRQAVWQMSESESVSAAALTSTAAIGLMLHRAASVAHARAARGSSHADRSAWLNAAACEADLLARWTTIAGQLSAIRTAHPGMTVLQIERLDLANLLARTASRSQRIPMHEAGRELSRAAATFDTVAGMQSRCLGRAHERGEILVVGRSLTHELLARRPDLLQAKLLDRVVPAPHLLVRRIQAAYAEIVPAHTTAEHERPPAA